MGSIKGVRVAAEAAVVDEISDDVAAIGFEDFIGERLVAGVFEFGDEAAELGGVGAIGLDLFLEIGGGAIAKGVRVAIVFDDDFVEGVKFDGVAAFILVDGGLGKDDEMNGGFDGFEEKGRGFAFDEAEAEIGGLERLRDGEEARDDLSFDGGSHKNLTEGNKGNEGPTRTGK